MTTTVANETTSAVPASAPEIDLSLYNPVTEGKATILFPKDNEVFYNPVQEFNRDMSIAAIRTWSEMFLQEKRDRIEKKVKKADGDDGKKATEKNLSQHINVKDFTILEALSATGLRSIRYAKEIPNLKQVVANDIEADAVESIKRNVKHNGLSEDLVLPNRGDAMQVMYKAVGNSHKYDVVDLDPYGTAAPFVDGAVQAVSEGGLLCVTCTDLAILTGSMHPETCFGKYGGMPLKGMFPHEMALRLVLQMLQNSAGRYRRYIVPLVSCSIDFYLRVFVRVYTSPAEVKKAASKTAIMYECTGCHAYAVQPLGKIQKKDNGQDRHTPSTGPAVGENCSNCGNTHHIGGPAWGSALHDKNFVGKMLAHVEQNESNYGTHQRMKGMLTVISEELDEPLYWTLGRLCGTLHCNSIPMVDLFSGILNAGYKVSVSHCGPQTVKTSAPSSVVWDVLRAWTKKHPVVMDNIGANSPARAILGKEPSIEIDFTQHPEAYPKSRSINLVRYQVNPTPNWGPKARAGKKRKQAEGE
ncbi:RNA methyltransferase tRNA(m5U54)methyltransferase [Apophysomyces sp. BC1034]|nr:RNA methyltransferase tRNA(m5U54)methyltransferase [Apophysomyces sp. BC1015]KAG0178579.1 RNA methyltransferase tRNA(m5U54)methyltransferase [Apophysomyces sp. BC1021]KAG0190131.1 RNA methyltransferase tRNA(m5U54)methyltransferase [Apophysomyces sp. BC1034]